MISEFRASPDPEDGNEAIANFKLNLKPLGKDRQALKFDLDHRLKQASHERYKNSHLRFCGT
jgi:hypothetical protein